MLQLVLRVRNCTLEIASRSFAGLLLLLLPGAGVLAQPNELVSIRRAVNNGRFDQVVAASPGEIARNRKSHAFQFASEVGVLFARSLIQLERYEEAATVLNEALSDAEMSKSARAIASVHFVKAALSRLQRDFPDAIGQARSGFARAPDDPQVKLEYYLAIGRILYSLGYDIAAIVWLEKAEKLSSDLRTSPAYLDVLGHLSFAWVSKFDYAKALDYAEKLVSAAGRTNYQYRYRLALFDLGNLRSSIGQERKAKALLEDGLALSLKARDDYQTCLFLNTLVLLSLYKGDTEVAEKNQLLLERIDRNRRFLYAATRNKAVIAALKGQDPVSERHFKELSLLKGHSDLVIPFWKLTLAENRRDWTRALEAGEALRTIVEKDNFRDELPGIYFSLAKAYWRTGRRELAVNYARRSAEIVEVDRPLGDAPLSLAMLETYHSVYRLLAEIEDDKNDAMSALKLADYSKARVLRDRIENSVLRQKPGLSYEIRRRADELSTKLINGADVRSLLVELERLVSLSSPRRDSEPKLVRGLIENMNAPVGTAIVSYFFTFEGQLRAFVIEHGKAVRSVDLTVSEREAESLADTMRTKIRDRVLFKSDGKKVYDRLLAPLSLDSGHIVVVPDKALWKIPFQALSADGNSYLIEQKRISYAPSVSILADMLQSDVPVRKTAQVYANNTYDRRYLSYVNREAAKVASVLGVAPLINATPQQFLTFTGGSDIVHFSMHAQETEDPLESFLAFKSQAGTSGRITVEDLLTIPLKKRSLSFLASCQTDKVLSGEGVVSIAWALLGSGSSTVISAQWEANDRSTKLFTEEFYIRYRSGKSAAAAMQAASIAMIQNKSSGSHEPYFWATFSLIGDYR